MSQPTVRSFSKVLGAHLQPAGGMPLPDTSISAVHVSELLDPTPYLSGGELILTTGISLPTGKADCARYVRNLRDAGVAAVALGVGPVHAAVPECLIRTCRAEGLPLLVVPDATPFLTITRAYWTAVSRVAEQHLTDALTAHRALVDAVSAADPTAAILRSLSRWLDGWAAMLDASGDLVDVHPSAFSDQAKAMRGDAKRLEATGVHSVSSSMSVDRSVVLYPLASGRQIIGYLAVGATDQLDPSQRGVVLTACGLLSMIATRSEGEDSGEAARRQAIAVLLDEGEVEAAHRLAARIGLPPMTREVRVISLRSEVGRDPVAVVQRWCRAAMGGSHAAGECWLVLPSDHGDLSDLESELSVGDAGLRGIVSELVRVEDVGLVRARQAAQLAQLAAGRIVLPVLVGFDADLASRLDGLVKSRPNLVTALVAFLAAHGQWEKAARSSSLHRNTLRYRVERAQDELAVDLEDPDTTARLWLMLRARGLA
jgi:purine catabolism regulator